VLQNKSISLDQVTQDNNFISQKHAHPGLVTSKLAFFFFLFLLISSPSPQKKKITVAAFPSDQKN
jgi:hypothetical protein